MLRHIIGCTMCTQRCRPTAMTVVFHLCALQDLTAHPKSVLTSTTCTVQNMYRMGGKTAVSVQSMHMFSHTCMGPMSKLIMKHILHQLTNTWLPMEPPTHNWNSERLQRISHNSVQRDRILSTATQATWSGVQIPNVGKIVHTRLYRPWDLPSLLYNGCWVPFQGKKQLGCGVEHPSPSSTKVKERIELILYSCSGPL